MQPYRPEAAGKRIVPERLFVVQLHSEEGDVAPRISGRVENVASGEHVRFDSLPELEQFMRRTAGYPD